MGGVWSFLENLWATPPSALHQNYILLGGFILLFGLVSLFVKERLYLTESLVATLVGIVFGPIGLCVVMPKRWYKDDFMWVLREAARIVIGIQVMAAGVSTPGGFLKKNKLAISMMLGPVMAVMWGISAVCIQLALSLGWRESLIIAACVTPTDPVLAHSVIKGKFAERYIPTRLRHLLAVESGANDGLGFPFMMLPVWLMLSKTTGDALSHWFWHTWMWEIFVSIIAGFICGFTARALLKASMNRKLIDKESFLVFTIALTLFVSGLVALGASDDLFAIFIAGNVFAWDDTFLEATEDSHITEVIDMLFNITFFVFFGSLIPWTAFAAFGIWRLLLAAGLVLIFRRLPIVMLMRPWIPTLQNRKEAFFAGWFGPMGVGAIFFAIQAKDIFLAHPEAPVSPAFIEGIFPVVAFIVLSSILIHGITVPLTNTHLKRRMKLKVKRRNKLAARLKDIPIDRMDSLEQTKGIEGMEMATLPETADPLTKVLLSTEVTGGGSGGSLSRTKTYPRVDADADLEEEYIYVTDDEDNNLPFDSPLGDVVVDSPATSSHLVSSDSTVQRGD